jgi:hypothetical protein
MEKQRVFCAVETEFLIIIHMYFRLHRSRDSAVGIATGYEVDGRGEEF